MYGGTGGLTIYVIINKRQGGSHDRVEIKEWARGKFPIVYPRGPMLGLNVYSDKSK